MLTNPENRGYTATINIGCDWAKGDVVLLNSDTEVPQRLVGRAARGRPVTP